MSRSRWWRRHDEVAVSELQKRSNPLRFGAIFLIVVAIVIYFGFTKRIPFKHGYRLNAVFNSAVDIRPKSPVRIAGVTVGKVSGVKREGKAALVTMEIENRGLPIHSDATLKIRPRIFLEGNFFVEVQPGSPSAKGLSSGATIPVAQTSDPVQFDQVLDALNTDTRSNLQTFLAEYGAALTDKPTALENAEQAPEVQGINAAQAINKTYQRSPEALRDGAIISQALGGREVNDLYNLFKSIEKVTSALNVHEQDLGELIGNFNAFTHILAAQAPSLKAAVHELPAALHSADRGFAELVKASPSIRTFSLDLIPGVEATPATIAAALPWIEQAKGALSANELGGVASGLRTAAPSIATVTGGQLPLQSQLDQFSQCLTKEIFPAGNTKIQDGPNTSGVENYKEFWYAMAGLASIGQNFNGNGAGGRFLTGAGGDTLATPPATIVRSNAPNDGVKLVGQATLPPEGTRPRFPGSEPPYKPLVRCDTQALPNFNGPLASGPADGSGG
jgi:phospholipid/cholesterol/gamma-HCH transport system substrate-binding protein